MPKAPRNCAAVDSSAWRLTSAKVPNTCPQREHETIESSLRSGSATKVRGPHLLQLMVTGMYVILFHPQLFHPAEKV